MERKIKKHNKYNYRLDKEIIMNLDDKLNALYLYDKNRKDEIKQLKQSNRVKLLLKIILIMFLAYLSYSGFKDWEIVKQIIEIVSLGM
jgi:hypothetical protein